MSETQIVSKQAERLDLTRRYIDELKCSAEALHYNFVTRCGVIHLPEWHCTDMDGCIALFERIDPEVQLIRTFAGSRVGTVYTRRGEGWSSGMGV